MITPEAWTPVIINIYFLHISRKGNYALTGAPGSPCGPLFPWKKYNRKMASGCAVIVLNILLCMILTCTYFIFGFINRIAQAFVGITDYVYAVNHSL